MATPPIPTVLPKSKPTAGVQRGKAAADFFTDLQATMANLGPLAPAIDDPESFLGFGDSRTVPFLPYLERLNETPGAAAERRRQSGALAKGMGLGLTTDVLGLVGDLPALLLSDAPKFAAALVMGKSMDEMPQTLIDEALNALRNTLGSDALAGYLGVSEEELNDPAVTSGRLLSSLVDPAVVYGVIRGTMGLAKARKATDTAEEGIASLLPAREEAGIVTSEANEIYEELQRMQSPDAIQQLLTEGGNEAATSLLQASRGTDEVLDVVSENTMTTLRNRLQEDSNNYLADFLGIERNQLTPDTPIQVYRVGDLIEGEVQSFSLSPNIGERPLPGQRLREGRGEEPQATVAYTVRAGDILSTPEATAGGIGELFEQEVLINSSSVVPFSQRLARETATRAGTIDDTIPDAAPTTIEDVIGNANFDPDPDIIDMQRMTFGARTDEQLVRDFEQRSSDLRQAQADLAAAQGNPDAPLLEAETAQARADLAEMDLNQIRNELVGRRDGHLVQITDAEAEALMPQMPQELADQIEAVRTGPMEPEIIDDVVSLDVTDTQGNIIPEKGFQAQPGGIGALDESAPVYGNYGIRIGASADQYLGKVEHYSPTMTNYYNFVGDRAFARQADNSGQMSAKQWLAALNKNPTSSQKIGPVAKELKDSEFERILLENPEKKYTKEEIRRLMTSRLPQTRERVFLESTMAEDTQNGTNPFSGDTIPYVSYQYSADDLESALDKGIILYSNTAPTIEIPGFGRVKPRAVHNYYGQYPGYYGHTRFIIVEGIDGKKYLQVNEIQSNSISNISSGFKTGWTSNTLGETVPEYAKTLEQRLNAWRGGNEDVRVPYTPEVHAKLQKLEDLKPELLKKEERLRIQANELDTRITQEEGDVNYRNLPEVRLSPDSERGTVIRFGRLTRNIVEDPAAIAGLLSDLQGYQPIMGGEAVDRISNLIVSKLDETGEAYSAIQAGNIADFYKSIFDDMERYRRDGNYYLWDNTLKQELTGSENLYVTPSEYDSILNEMTDDQLFRILVDDRIRHASNQAVEEGVQSFISSNQTFTEAFENLPVEDLETMAITSLDDTLNTPAVRERKKEIAKTVFDKFSDQDLETLRDSYLSYVNDELTGMTGYTPQESRIQEISDDMDVFKDFVQNNVQYLLSLDQRGLLAKGRLKKLRKDLSDVNDELTNIEGDGTLGGLKEDYQNAVFAQPDGDDLQTLAEIAKKTKVTDGKKGFQAPEPYNSDADFYQFATRSAIKQAEKLGLDGVIFPDAMYLATQPQRSPNDAFLRNYGRVLDKELAELSKADSNAGVVFRRTDTPVTNNEDPGMRISGRTNNNFVVEGIDPSDEAVQAALQPLRDEARARRRAIDTAEAAGEDTFTLMSEYREAKRVLDAEVRRLSREYATPLRVVEFDNPANRDLAQRPIRRAAGGMVRSGIGAMAREVM